MRDALGGTNGASAALVYVPHTTAGVTINERIDPELVTDSRTRSTGSSTTTGTGATTTPTARTRRPMPGLARSSPQVLIPLRDGSLALGTYQGIFFCEFDGPRDRKVYVTTL